MERVHSNVMPPVFASEAESDFTSNKSWQRTMKEKKGQLYPWYETLIKSINIYQKTLVWEVKSYLLVMLRKSQESPLGYPDLAEVN